jgi:hypothetical protein
MPQVSKGSSAEVLRKLSSVPQIIPGDFKEFIRLLKRNARPEQRTDLLQTTWGILKSTLLDAPQCLDLISQVPSEFRLEFLNLVFTDIMVKLSDPYLFNKPGELSKSKNIINPQNLNRWFFCDALLKLKDYEREGFLNEHLQAICNCTGVDARYTAELIKTLPADRQVDFANNNWNILHDKVVLGSEWAQFLKILLKTEEQRFDFFANHRDQLPNNNLINVGKQDLLKMFSSAHKTLCESWMQATPILQITQAG